MKNTKNYYLGLDIGTDSVGYAAVDETYSLMKFRGEPAWGVTIFDAASLSDERRVHRTARRRIDRRKQRVALIQELFAPEILKKDARFYIRLAESALYGEDSTEQYSLFNDPDYKDKDYHNAYPTIHHLIRDLMHSSEPHDVRLVYLACAWLVKHRGHFLKNIDKDNLGSVKDFTLVYGEFEDFFDGEKPWSCDHPEKIGEILCKDLNITGKNKALIDLLFDGKKPPKNATDEFPYSRECIVKLLAGGSCKPKDIFCNDEYEQVSTIALSMEDDKLEEVRGEIGDDFDLIDVLRKLYDWSVLANILGEFDSISEAKVDVYEKHKKDLEFLKKVIRNYRPEKYNKVFRTLDEKNYPAYVSHTDENNRAKWKLTNVEEFSKYILGIIKDIEPNEEDAVKFEDMKHRLEMRTFLPKQRTTDNRVIPYQLYWYELKTILEKASTYLPFLTETDADGLTISEKILSVISFRIPYFVGPLNAHSPFAWIERKAEGKIYP